MLPTGVLLKELNYKQNDVFIRFESFTEIVENISKKRPRATGNETSNKSKKETTAQKKVNASDLYKKLYGDEEWVLEVPLERKIECYAMAKFANMTAYQSYTNSPKQRFLEEWNALSHDEKQALRLEVIGPATRQDEKR